MCRSNLFWRGYIGHWVLHADGRLQLTQFEFPTFDDTPSAFQQVQDGFVGGDFEMFLRPWFSGATSSIPFVDGHIVNDKSRWRISDIVTAYPHANKEYGLICNNLCWIPRSLMNAELKSEPEACLGQGVVCVMIGSNRDQIILMPMIEWNRRFPQDRKEEPVSNPDMSGEWYHQNAPDLGKLHPQVRNMLANLRKEIPLDDTAHYLNPESAYNILVAITGLDCGLDPDRWEDALVRPNAT